MSEQPPLAAPVRSLLQHLERVGFGGAPRYQDLASPAANRQARIGPVVLAPSLATAADRDRDRPTVPP